MNMTDDRSKLIKIKKSFPMKIPRLEAILNQPMRIDHGQNPRINAN